MLAELAVVFVKLAEGIAITALAVANALAPIGEATVIAYVLNVREEPMGRVVDTLYLNETVDILDETRGWYLVAQDQEQLGWVHGKWLDFGVAEQVSATIRDNPISCASACWPSIDTYKTPAPQHIIGNAVMYAPYLMEATAKYNGLSLDGFLGGVAMPSVGDMGEVVWLRRPGLTWEGPYLVVDVSQRAHMWEHVVIKGQSVEVDFPTAVRWGMASGTENDWSIVHGRLDGVEVYKGLEPPTVDSTPINYKEHFLHTATLGQPGQTVYWSSAMARYTSYAEYQLALTGDEPDTHYVSVDTMALRLREAPTTESRILTVLHRGDVVPVLDTLGIWVKVQFANHVGWLHSDYVVQSDPPVSFRDEGDAMALVGANGIDCTNEDPYDGYWYRGDCIPGVVAEESILFDYPAVASGKIVHYDPGIMSQVSSRFDMQGYKGGVALMSCAEVGNSVWLLVAGVVDGPYKVTDCSRDYGLFRLIAYSEIVVEVGYKTYERLSEQGLWNGYATVCKTPDCAGSSAWLSDYWLATVQFEQPVTQLDD